MDDPHMKAVNDKIVAIKLEDGKTAGGVELPKGTILDGPKYQVVSVGPGRVLPDGTRVPVCVQPGDYILMAIGGAGMKYRGKEYAVLSEAMVEVMIPEADYNPGTQKKLEILKS